MVVIEFDEPFDLKPDVIEPACLPTQEIPNNSLCYTSGWGRFRFGNMDCWVFKDGVWLKIFKKEIYVFFTGGYTTMAVINPPERKLAKPTSMHSKEIIVFWMLVDDSHSVK